MDLCVGRTLGCSQGPWAMAPAIRARVTNTRSVHVRHGQRPVRVVPTTARALPNGVGNRFCNTINTPRGGIIGFGSSCVQTPLRQKMRAASSKSSRVINSKRVTKMCWSLEVSLATSAFVAATTSALWVRNGRQTQFFYSAALQQCVCIEISCVLG